MAFECVGYSSDRYELEVTLTQMVLHSTDYFYKMVPHVGSRDGIQHSSDNKQNALAIFGDIGECRSQLFAFDFLHVQIGSLWYQ
jgi:hypothetical protein